LRKKVYSN